MHIKKLIRPLVIPLVLVGLQASTMAATEQQSTDSADENSTKTSTLSTDNKSEGRLVVTARQQTLQAPGVSTITSEAIKKHPIQRDLSEIIRTQPGVNLTGMQLY